MDAADYAQAETDAELNQQLGAAVRAAREQLAGDGSARCADCDEEIPSERRLAMPSAIRCICCQAFFERLGKVTP